MSDQISACTEDVKKFLGIAPYNTYTNICAGDPYFYKDLLRKYGDAEVTKTIRSLTNGVHNNG